MIFKSNVILVLLDIGGLGFNFAETETVLKIFGWQ